MGDIVWADPPAPKPRRVDIVATQLMMSPGVWARIETNVPALQLMPWWGPLRNDARFEVKFVTRNPDDGLFGPRDIYARAVADKPSKAPTGADEMEER